VSHTRFPRAWLEIALLLLATGSAVSALNVQFLPETDVYLKLSPSWRTYLQAKNDQDAGASPDSSIGPREGRRKGVDAAIACAVCHDTELRYQGKRIRVDGDVNKPF
jgi:hypothetical protein